MKTRTIHLAGTLGAATPLLASLLVSLTPGSTAYGQAYTLSTLATFNGNNGTEPNGGLTFDGSGNLYGTTYAGGANNEGTVFEIAASTHTLSTISIFNSTNGADPFAGLTADNSGNLYGTTLLGGARSNGTVFELATGTHALTTLVNFTGGTGGQFTNGGIPTGGVTLDSRGIIYGATSSGGLYDHGTVFEIAAGSSTLTTLFDFNGTNGDLSQAGVTLDSSGNVYGTTYRGGANGDGTVFELSASTHALTTLATFTSSGESPTSGVVLDSSGNVYGTTPAGGASGDGTIFEIAAGTHAFTTLVTFNGSNGNGPANLTLGADGNIYGATGGGGANGNGTVFDLASGSHAFSTLYSFTGSNSGPNGGLLLDSSGDIYGTTPAGGTNGDGTVFELSPSGAASAPEPGSIIVLIAALPLVSGLMNRRRP